MPMPAAAKMNRPSTAKAIPRRLGGGAYSVSASYDGWSSSSTIAAAGSPSIGAAPSAASDGADIIQASASAAVLSTGASASAAGAAATAGSSRRRTGGGGMADQSAALGAPVARAFSALTFSTGASSNVGARRSRAGLALAGFAFSAGASLTSNTCLHDEFGQRIFDPTSSALS